MNIGERTFVEIKKNKMIRIVQFRSFEFLAVLLGFVFLSFYWYRSYSVSLILVFVFMVFLLQKTEVKIGVDTGYVNKVISFQGIPLVFKEEKYNMTGNFLGFSKENSANPNSAPIKIFVLKLVVSGNSTVLLYFSSVRTLKALYGVLSGPLNNYNLVLNEY